MGLDRKGRREGAMAHGQALEHQSGRDKPTPPCPHPFPVLRAVKDSDPTSPTQERMVTDIALGFRNAGGELLKELAKCLDFLNDLPFFQSYKAHTWAALDIRSGDKILDVACRIGFDVIEMAKRFPAAEIWGVDISEGFLAIAGSRSGKSSQCQICARRRRPSPAADPGPALVRHSSRNSRLCYDRATSCQTDLITGTYAISMKANGLRISDSSQHGRSLCSSEIVRNRC